MHEFELRNKSLASPQSLSSGRGAIIKVLSFVRRTPSEERV
jgi:hypothetical protein